MTSDMTSDTSVGAEHDVRLGRACVPVRMETKDGNEGWKRRMETKDGNEGGNVLDPYFEGLIGLTVPFCVTVRLVCFRQGSGDSMLLLIADETAISSCLTKTARLSRIARKMKL